MYMGHPAIQTWSVSPRKGKNGFYALMPNVPTAKERSTAFFILSIGLVYFSNSLGANENESAIICKCPSFLKMVTGRDTLRMLPPLRILVPMDDTMCLNIFLCSLRSF
jgi:hypothetical protein